MLIELLKVLVFPAIVGGISLMVKDYLEREKLESNEVKNNSMFMLYFSDSIFTNINDSGEGNYKSIENLFFTSDQIKMRWDIPFHFREDESSSNDLYYKVDFSDRIIRDNNVNNIHKLVPIRFHSKRSYYLDQKIKDKFLECRFIILKNTENQKDLNLTSIKIIPLENITEEISLINIKKYSREIPFLKAYSINELMDEFSHNKDNSRKKYYGMSLFLDIAILPKNFGRDIFFFALVGYTPEGTLYCLKFSLELMDVTGRDYPNNNMMSVMILEYRPCYISNGVFKDIIESKYYGFYKNKMFRKIIDIYRMSKSFKK